MNDITSPPNPQEAQKKDLVEKSWAFLVKITQDVESRFSQADKDATLVLGEYLNKHKVGYIHVVADIKAGKANLKSPAKKVVADLNAGKTNLKSPAKETAMISSQTGSSGQTV